MKAWESAQCPAKRSEEQGIQSQAPDGSRSLLVSKSKLRAWGIVVSFVAILVLTAGCIGGEGSLAPGPDGETSAIDVRLVEVTIHAIECPDGYDNMREDNVCLAYNGQIPGPTWVFEEGASVEITLVHNVEKTIKDLDIDEELAERLSEARYSLHRHGLSLAACHDGVAQPAGTEVCDSTVAPGDSITYAFNTTFPGYWHYHDHAHTFTEDPVHEPILGHEGTVRGLWGSFIVLEEGDEAPDHLFDLHILEASPGDPDFEAGTFTVRQGGTPRSANGGLGLEETIEAGERFGIVVTGLGERTSLETVTLTGPDGDLVDEALIGPGVSRGFTVHDAHPGTYTWSVESASFGAEELPGPLAPIETHAQGHIEVLPSDGESEGSSSDGFTPSNHGAQDSKTQDVSSPMEDPDRTFVIQFDFWSASYTSSVRSELGEHPSGGLPLLEAYAGETLEFHVSALDSGPHTFHLHGHPWEDPHTGDIIDTVPLYRGNHTHSFTVTAGLDEGHHGDWLYHCHMNHDVAMWSILRVYPNTMSAHGPLDDLTVEITDMNGAPIEDASLAVRWNPNADPDPTLGTSNDGQVLPSTVTETLPGTYAVRADLPEHRGELVIESEHATGDSLIRLALDGEGSYEENRDVGQGPVPPSSLDATSLMESVLD